MMSDQRKYIDFYDYDSKKVNTLLESKRVENRLEGLLYVVLGSGDYERSAQLIFQYLQSSETDLKRNAILCIGHLVRIHRKLDLEKYFPVLEKIIQDQDLNLIEDTESSIEDIWIFLGKEGIGHTSLHSCISRIFDALKVSKQAEESGEYEKGILKLKTLQKSESNPSVLRIQNSCLEFLSHCIEDQNE